MSDLWSFAHEFAEILSYHEAAAAATCYNCFFHLSLRVRTLSGAKLYAHTFNATPQIKSLR